MGKKATPPRPWQTGQPHKHFHRLYEDLTESEAFKTLSPQAITIYVIIASQYKERFTDDKYGKDCVMCPYSRFKNITTNTSQIKKYLKELEDHGFIEIHKQGGLYRGANVYRLCSNWMSWRPKK